MNIVDLKHVMEESKEFVPFYKLPVGTKFRRQQHHRGKGRGLWPFSRVLMKKISYTQACVIHSENGHSHSEGTFWPETEMVHVPWSMNESE